MNLGEGREGEGFHIPILIGTLKAASDITLRNKNSQVSTTFVYVMCVVSIGKREGGNIDQWRYKWRSKGP